MNITVVLHGILREKLPPETKGRDELTFPEGSTVQDVKARLDIGSGVIMTINDEIEQDRNRILHEGDWVRFLRPSKGG